MDVFDVAVIGGGTVGCAVVHDLSLKGYKCVLLEKNEHLLMGASCGNSGIFASGFDTDLSTMEGRCLSQASALNEATYRKYNIPKGKPGAIVCAFTKEEAQRLPSLLTEADNSGTQVCRLLSPEEVQQMEPNISADIMGGMWVPGERAVEPWLLPITLAHIAKRAKAKVSTSCEVVSGRRLGDGGWELQTTKGPVVARFVVNAGGLYGDNVEEISHPSPFRSAGVDSNYPLCSVHPLGHLASSWCRPGSCFKTIKPRQGDYVIYSETAGRLVNHILLPVPTERTKGVIVFPSVHGHLVVGPTADDVSHREAPSVGDSTICRLMAHAQRVVPALSDHVIVGTYAGLRPATEHKDYCIRHHPNRNWVTVGGIRSTGLSACLAIASYTHYLLQHALGASPSRHPPPVVNAPTWRQVGEASVSLDGELYQITHPLSRLGLAPTSRL